MERKKLKEKRIFYNLTQAEVAEEAKITRTFYSQIELGKRTGTIDTWLRIAQVLYIPPQEIINFILENREDRS